jgi:hypothetical protein
MMNAAALHGHRIPRNLRLMIFSFHILKCKTRQYYASAARPAGAQYVLNQPWLVLPVQEIATKCQELVQSSSSLPVSSDLLRLLIRTQQLLRPAVSDHAAASGLWASSVAAAAMCPCVTEQSALLVTASAWHETASFKLHTVTLVNFEVCIDLGRHESI